VGSYAGINNMLVTIVKELESAPSSRR
jgi:hypothetical protein